MSTANEPAYPTPDSGGHWTNPETGYTGYQNPGQPGMTKREVIAMHALQGLLANGLLFAWLSDKGLNAEQSTTQIVEGALRSTDALLSALSREEAKP